MRYSKETQIVFVLLIVVFVLTPKSLPDFSAAFWVFKLPKLLMSYQLLNVWSFKNITLMYVI